VHDADGAQAGGAVALVARALVVNARLYELVSPELATEATVLLSRTRAVEI